MDLGIRGKKALVCAAAGMIVAVPALMFHRYFRARIDGSIVDMEHEAIRLLDTLEAQIAQARNTLVAARSRQQLQITQLENDRKSRAEAVARLDRAATTLEG